MKILSKELTGRTAEIVTKIESNVKLPVRYYPIKSRPNYAGDVAGSVNPFGENGEYPVWLNDDLPQDPFEVDVLHELRHIVQVESRFSAVFNKDSIAFSPQMAAPIQYIGGKLSSLILDMEVNCWLKSLGYSYSFFTDGNANFLQSNVSQYPLPANELQMAELCLKLLHGTLYTDDKTAIEIFSIYDHHGEALKIAQELRKRLLRMKMTDPVSTALGHGLLIDALNFWKYYYVGLDNRKIRTQKEYLAFCTEAEFSPDK